MLTDQCGFDGTLLLYTSVLDLFSAITKLKVHLIVLFTESEKNKTTKKSNHVDFCFYGVSKRAKEGYKYLLRMHLSSWSTSSLSNTGRCCRSLLCQIK